LKSIAQQKGKDGELNRKGFDDKNILGDQRKK